jgi:hypothetical protein
VRAIWRWRSVPGAHASISSATISPASPCCREARKLEYLLADALANEAPILVTEGAVQSNHTRITAAAAVIARLRSVLVLDARHGSEVAGNLLLDHLQGAQVRIVPDKAARSRFMASIGDELRRAATSCARRASDPTRSRPVVACRSEPSGLWRWSPSCWRNW